MHDKPIKALVAALRSVYTGTAIRVSDSDRDAVDLSTVLLDYQEGCSGFEPSTMIHLHHESQIPEPVRIDRQLIEEHGGTVIGDRRRFHQEGGICTREATRRISLPYEIKGPPSADNHKDMIGRYVYLPGDEGNPVGKVVASRTACVDAIKDTVIHLDVEGKDRDIARLARLFPIAPGERPFLLGGQHWDDLLGKSAKPAHEKSVYDKDSDKGFATLTLDVVAPYHTMERGEDVFCVASSQSAAVYVGTITEATRQNTRYGRVHRLRIRGTEDATAKALETFSQVGSGKTVLVQGERFRVQGEMSWQRDA